MNGGILKIIVVLFAILSEINPYINAKVGNMRRNNKLKSKKHSIPLAETRAQNKSLGKYVIRREGNLPDGDGENQNGLQGFDEEDRPETYYEPYWNSGEWVFLRITTLFPGAGLKKKKRPKMNKDYILTTTERIKYPASYYRDCDLYCSGYYKDFYGPVCAQWFDTQKWKYKYKFFPTVCDMETYNCKTKKSLLYQLHRNTVCAELSQFKQLPKSNSSIKNRKEKWSPYSYHRTSTLAPTFTYTATRTMSSTPPMG